MIRIPKGTNRRAFLRGAGVLLGLPALEAFAGEDDKRVAPNRLAVLYTPNGVNVPEWTVKGGGRDYALSPTLKLLEPVRDRFTVISGLNHEEATPGPDGPGDHSRAAPTYLTGKRARKTAGADVRAGVSADQVAARVIGGRTRLPSLELNTDAQRSSGTCDSGYSCAYQFNISWKTPSMPLPGEPNPRAVFERLFGGGSIGGEHLDSKARQALKRSVLDYVLGDARALERRLGARDREKLDQYFSAIRGIEKRVSEAETPRPDGPPVPKSIPASFQDHLRILLDLVVLAFQTDTTRIVTFMLAHEGSNRSFPDIGIPEAHHQLSHHRDKKTWLDRIAKIDRFYVSQLKYFLDRMDATKEGDSSLLDGAMVLYGGGISEGNKHWHHDLPTILAGGGGGTLHPGRHLRVADRTPMSNLLLALLERLDVHPERMGDSTGALTGL